MARNVLGIAPGQLPSWHLLGRIYARAREAVSFLTVPLPTAGACLYLFTLGIVRLKNRILIKEEISVLIGLRLFPTHYVPPVAITSLVPSQVSVTLCEQAKVLGNTALEELFVIAELLQARQPLACFEIGTFDGRTTLNIAANTPEEAVIYTLDLPREQMDRTAFSLNPYELFAVDKETSGTRYRGTVWEGKIRQLYGDSATFDFTPYQGKIDFVFIDGSHAYEYALSDSRNAISLLRHGKGFILWHDYTNWPEVHKAVNYLRATDSRFANTRYIEGTSFACLVCE